jgi:hypothetical protein
MVWSCLDRRTTERGSAEGLTEEKFAAMLVAGRRLILKLAEPRIIAYFVSQMKLVYSDVKCNGKEIRSIDDFITYLRKGPWNNKRREVANFALHTAWGASNVWALDVEVDVMKVLEMKYGNKKIAAHKPSQKREKNHPGNFCKQMCVNKKGSLFNRVQQFVRREYKEAIYVRILKPEKLLESKPKKSIPKVVWIKEATRDRFGFHCLIGICVGHKDEFKQANMHQEENEVTPETPNTKNKMLEWLHENLLSGETIETTEDLIRLAQGNSERSSHFGGDPLMHNRVAALEDEDDDDDDDDLVRKNLD